MKEKTLTGTSAVTTTSRKISRRQNEHICLTLGTCSEVVGRERQKKEQHNKKGLENMCLLQISLEFQRKELKKGYSSRGCFNMEKTLLNLAAKWKGACVGNVITAAKT